MKTAVMLLVGVLSCATVPPDVNFQPFLDFTLKVFKELCKQEDGNFVLSVKSLVEQLIILQEVSSQDIPALPDNNQDVYLSIFSQVASGVSSSSSAALFPGGRTRLPEELSTTLAERLGADVLPLTALSSWLRQHDVDTGSLRVSSDLGEDSTLVAAASSFECCWEEPPAHQLPSVSVSYLASPSLGRFPVLLDDKLATDFLRLPLQGGRLWLTLGLPKKHGSVQQLAEALHAWPTDDELRLFEPRDVVVQLPSLDLHSTLDLTRTLMSAGVDGLDISEEQLTNATVDPQLIMGKILQWTSFKCAEDTGSNGVAANLTTATLDEGSWLQFRVDHPFLFLVSAHGFKIPLFLGKVASP